MVGRASEAMWIFSTGLCAVVGVMVAVGVAYQIHLDRMSKKKKREFQQQQTNRGRPLETLQSDHPVRNPSGESSFSSTCYIVRLEKGF